MQIAKLPSEQLLFFFPILCIRAKNRIRERYFKNTLRDGRKLSSASKSCAIKLLKDAGQFGLIFKHIKAQYVSKEGEPDSREFCSKAGDGNGKF